MTKKLAKPVAPWSREKAAREVVTLLDWSAELRARLIEACPGAQRDAVLDPSRWVAVRCPRGAGKSTTAEVRALLTMLARLRAQGVYVATTKDQGVEIAWNKLLDVLKKLGIEYDAGLTRRVITLVKNGSTIKFAGADDKASIEKLRGIPWDFAIIDEAASHPQKLLESLIVRVLAPRMGERNGWVMLIGSPGHLLSGLFYEATRPGGEFHIPYAERNDPKWDGFERLWSSHHWTLKDQADAGIPPAVKLWAAALKTKELQGWSDSHPVWMREYLGLWAADDTDMVFRYRSHLDDGAAWNQWDPERRGPLRIATPPVPSGCDPDGAFVVVTFDKGFKDNFAVNAWKFWPDDSRRRWWHVFAHEAPKMSVRGFAILLLGAKETEEGEPPEPNDLDAALDGKLGLFGELGYPVACAGDVDGAFLVDLQYYGIRAVKVDKKLDSKVKTVEEINGDLAEGRAFVLKDSPLEQQFQTLQWATADETGGVVKENKGQANHSTDTAIYARRLIAPMFGAGPPATDEADTDAPAPRAKTTRAKPARTRPGRPTTAHEGWNPLLASSTYEGPE